MPRRRASFFVSLFCLLCLGCLVTLATRAEPVRTPHVEAELVAEHTALTPGATQTVALRLKMIPHWHTYWRNPGDSGLPTTIEWRLPKGFAAGPIQWPYPQRLPLGPLTNFGYEDEVLLLIDLKVPEQLTRGESITLAALAKWLVCNEDRCIPERAQLTLPLTVGGDGRSAHAAAVARARAALPVPAATSLTGWGFAARRTAEGAVIDVTPASGVALGTFWFFPYHEGRIENSAAQALARGAGVYRLAVPAAQQPVGEFSRATGILVAPEGFGHTNGPRAVEIDLPFGIVSTPVLEGVSTVPLNLELALLFAFIGGVILNLMPCVLPVISIKALSFVQHGQRDAHITRRHGLMFALGVLVSFWMLAGVLLGLRGAGAELGWGFQLQSPAVIAILALFFFALGLNLSGVYEFGTMLPGNAAAWRARNPYVDSLFSGVLAVAVASPCTAPFMGAALGYAVSQPAFIALSVFTALGVGMAMPYALLSWFPGWLRHVPRPGPWTLRLKQSLAFPIYATVVWLAWVLGLQAGMNAVALLLAALVLLGIAAWLLGMRFERPIWTTATAAALTILAVGLALPGGISEPASRSALAGANWERFSPERVSAHTRAGQPVFVDFTAAWCVTCQVNKRLVLHTRDIQDAFTEKGVTLMIADWTRQDDTIARTLAQFGRNSVPLYVLYRPDREPLVLPEILTHAAVRAALTKI